MTTRFCGRCSTPHAFDEDMFNTKVNICRACGGKRFDLQPMPHSSKIGVYALSDWVVDLKVFQSDQDFLHSCGINPENGF